MPTFYGGSEGGFGGGGVPRDSLAPAGGSGGSSGVVG